jgi:hypothetical protein
MRRLFGSTFPLIVSALLAPLPGAAQTELRRPIPYPVVPPAGFQRAIEAGTRTTDGRPGALYWQQWTDYRLRARLLPEEKRVEGSAHLVYHNRSPYGLRAVVLQLFQNLHAEGVARKSPSEVTGGVDIQRVAAGGVELTEITRRGEGAGYGIDGTTMPILLPQPLASGDSLEIEVDWAFKVPQRGASGRMGWSEDDLFHIAYWYPQMAVFDDVVGWQADPFLGGAEFYMGFGSYDLSVEAPEGWVIMATGELTNAEQVLPAAVLERYRQAQDSDDVVHILTETDFGPGTATLSSESGYLTWEFHSDTVRDVAFSAMSESLWDAARTPVGDRDGDGDIDYALINAFYRANAPLWREQWRYGQHSIDFLSRWTGYPYPWPHMTSVEGGGIIGGGMEFPMMTLMGSYNSRQASDTSLYGVTAHELAHMWFPMIVGVDERRRAWMDEGTTSFNGDHASDEFYPGTDSHADTRQGYLAIARMGREGELMRHSDYHYPGPAYGTASYSKPATLLNTLRALIGRETFDAAYHEFIDTWAYKHPKPWDFFNFFSTASGMDLDWFWRAWYYETWTLDHSVAEVHNDPDGATIVIEDRGWAPMPARLTITREGGETLEREVPVDVWLSGATRAEVAVSAGPPVVRVELDPDHDFPDIDRSNDVWERTEQISPGR